MSKYEWKETRCVWFLKNVFDIFFNPCNNAYSAGRNLSSNNNGQIYYLELAINAFSQICDSNGERIFSNLWIFLARSTNSFSKLFCLNL